MTDARLIPKRGDPSFASRCPGFSRIKCPICGGSLGLEWMNEPKNPTLSGWMSRSFYCKACGALVLIQQLLINGLARPPEEGRPRKVPKSPSKEEGEPRGA